MNLVSWVISHRDGGYDDGYRAVRCLWGKQPGSMVASYLAGRADHAGDRVLDLGCGEGKNAAAFAKAGCDVDAIDCSPKAIENGRKAFPDWKINWINCDVTELPLNPEAYDTVVAYGLFHCLRDQGEIDAMINSAKRSTKIGGHNIICAFNDRSHDLSGHPGFRPTLVEHTWYVGRYSNWQIIKASDSDLIEAHPHNQITHHHSITRLIAMRLG